MKRWSKTTNLEALVKLETSLKKLQAKQLETQLQRAQELLASQIRRMEKHNG